jgi:NAD(P) transhydrogenase subunit alpha
VATLVAASHQVEVEVGAGLRAGFTDAHYREAGANIAQRGAVIGSSGVVVQVNGPTAEELASPEWQQLGTNHTLVALHDPLWLPERADALAKTDAAIVSLELIPRTTRAQSMDVLSSMATVAGYEAALLGADRLPKMLPMMMTAAGTVPPARFVILGAGVAGLQAIATARRLGAVVEAYDIRPAAMEQIESVGAKAIEIDLSGPSGESTEDAGGYAKEQTDDVNRRQNELLTPYIADADVVISTAAIPGAASPELVTSEMVEAMRPGSVIVDLAAERGGNCRLTVADEEVQHDGVLILGPTDLASRAAATSSQMFSNNVISLLKHLTADGEPTFDMTDEITAGTVVAHSGHVIHPAVRSKLGLAPLDPPTEEQSSGQEPAGETTGEAEDPTDPDADPEDPQEHSS